MQSGAGALHIGRAGVTLWRACVYDEAEGIDTHHGLFTKGMLVVTTLPAHPLTRRTMMRFYVRQHRFYAKPIARQYGRDDDATVS
jgi:hypothetical protein